MPWVASSALPLSAWRTDSWLDRHTERRPGGRRDVNLALLAGVTLDGVPENLATGVALIESGGTTLLVAISPRSCPRRSFPS